MSLQMLEKISCQTRKGENVCRHIADPEDLLDCEDPIVRPLVRLEKEFKISDPSPLLNSRYMQVFNHPIDLNAYRVEPKRFRKVYELILTARFFFGIESGTIRFILTIYMSISKINICQGD